MFNLKLGKTVLFTVITAILLAVFTGCNVSGTPAGGNGGNSGSPGGGGATTMGPNVDTSGWTSLPAGLAGSSWTGTQKIELEEVNQNGEKVTVIETNTITSWSFNGDGTTVMEYTNQHGNKIRFEGRCKLDGNGNLSYRLEQKTFDGTPSETPADLIWGVATLDLDAGTGSDSDASYTIDYGDTVESELFTMALQRASGGNGGAKMGLNVDTSGWTSLPAGLTGSLWSGSMESVVEKSQLDGRTKLVVEKETIDSWSFNADGSSVMEMTAYSGDKLRYEGPCKLEGGVLKYRLELKVHNGNNMPANSDLFWGTAQVDLNGGSIIDIDGVNRINLGFSSKSVLFKMTLQKKAQGN